MRSIEAIGSCWMVYSSQALIWSAEKISMRKFRHFGRECGQPLCGLGRLLLHRPLVGRMRGRSLCDGVRMGAGVARRMNDHRLLLHQCRLTYRSAAGAIGRIGLAFVEAFVALAVIAEEIAE